MTNRDTIESWLAARRPAPPPALRARLAEVLPAGAVGVDACLRAGEALLERLLEDDCASRGSALDLLVADALVTYAFEDAADDPTALEARARAAMLEIAAIGEPRPQARDARLGRPA